MKNTIGIFLMTFSVMVLVQGCGSDASSIADSNISSSDEVYQQNNIAFDAANINAYPLEDLSPEEISGLQFMREEEKLARDVYLVMYENYGLRVFGNISSSEQTHMDALKILLDKYELEDPVGENGLGTFVNPDLQSLFEQLIITGNISEVEALKVGAVIEEIDIIDLQTEIDDITDNADMEFVFNNLKNASCNHLRAFVRNLSARGVTYEPQYLDTATYNSIIN